MASEGDRGPNIRELESLRIVRAAEPRKRGRSRAIVIALVLAAMVAGAGLEAYRLTLGRPLEVETADVAMRAAGQSGVLLTGSGYVITRAKYITIGTKIQGQIVEEPIEEGKIVKKGDLLARIDDRDYQAQLSQAKADYDLALANVTLKQAKLNRVQKLHEQTYTSQDELDVAVNDLAVAQANLERAKAAIDYAKFNVSQTVIRSPIDGVVLQKYREAGATIVYGTGSGTTDITQLASEDDMRVEVDINESDIAKVKLGMPAAIVPDAYPDRTFAAHVVKVYPEADRQKGTVKVEVRFDYPDLSIIKPEMSAKVSFLAPDSGAPQATIVLVPKKAIMGNGASTAVWIVRDGLINRLSIATGGEFQDGIEVKRGLSGGETVIISPPDALKEGQRVTVKAG
ncbi:MAG TPA: efflux RND transporter periplasmic adaptor subunit [Candidatus Binataceae bacterium]